MSSFCLRVVFGVTLLLFFATACTPALNWREVRTAKGSVLAWMPCKPESAEREVQLRHQISLLQMQACRAEEMDFSLAALPLPTGWDAQDAIVAWRTANLATLGLAPDAAKQLPGPVFVKGALAGPTAQQWAVNTSKLQVQWLWFAIHGWVVQLGIYAPMDALSMVLVSQQYFSEVSVP